MAARKAPAPKPRKIALVGTTPTSAAAPYHDRSWEIWTWNRPGLSLDRWDRLFEIHKKWQYEQDESGYLATLRQTRLPQRVVSVVPLFDDPANVVVDRDALFARYGAIWLSSSITYAFACALDEKPAAIGLWGIDFESREEYVVQFAGCRHFIDLARERGINVHVPDKSNLLREPAAYPDRFETVLAITLETKAQRLEKLINRQAQNAYDALHTLGSAEGKLAEAKLRGAGMTTLFDKQEYVNDRRWQLRLHEAALNRLKGELVATQHYKRLFVWNVLPPDLGSETETESEDLGPI